VPKKKLTYRNGDWFAVPLPGGGLAVGLIARMDGKGVVLGYFFGPRRHEKPSIATISRLDRKYAISTNRFGDLGLLSGKWPVIGAQPGWCPEDWPVPVFGRIDISGEKAWRVRHADPSLDCLAEEQIRVEEAKALPRDGLFGAVAIERLLNHLLPLTNCENHSDTVCSNGSHEPVPAPGLSSVLQKRIHTPDGINAVMDDAESGSIDSEHAVFIFLVFSGNGIGNKYERIAIERLEDELSNLVQEHGVGELDGNEIGEGYYRLYIYGQNADTIARLIAPTLSALPPPPGSYILKRYGGPDADTQQIDL
jgi:hypothetical protein